MEIKLNRAYVSTWDNIEYPIFRLYDGCYLCIAYSGNHKIYFINIYSEEDFVKQGFQEDDYCDEIFECITKEDIE